jgi:hypothetical protein
MNSWRLPFGPDAGGPENLHESEFEHFDSFDLCNFFDMCGYALILITGTLIK